MTKKEELIQLVDKYDIAHYDYVTLKKYQIFAIPLFFFGGFVLFLYLNNKKRKLSNQKLEVLRKLNNISGELSTEEYLEIKQKIILVRQQ